MYQCSRVFAFIDFSLQIFKGGRKGGRIDIWISTPVVHNRIIRTCSIMWLYVGSVFFVVAIDVDLCLAK